MVFMPFGKSGYSHILEVDEDSNSFLAHEVPNLFLQESGVVPPTHSAFEVEDHHTANDPALNVHTAPAHTRLTPEARAGPPLSGGYAPTTRF